VAADYYVAADENDSNPGMILQPFATIEEARLAVQYRIATWDDEGHYGHAARGNETWVESIARRFGLESTLRPRGRSSTQLTKQRLLTPLFVPRLPECHDQWASLADRRVRPQLSQPHEMALILRQGPFKKAIKVEKVELHPK
jgi:hypothetical protein